MKAPDTAFRIDIVDVECIDSLPDKTLLESLEAANVHIHYHCREGFCGACRTKLIEGEVNYTTDPLAYFDDDEILPCCCTPASALKIKVQL